MEDSKIIHMEYPGGISGYLTLTKQELTEFEKIIRDNPELEPWECMKKLNNKENQPLSGASPDA